MNDKEELVEHQMERLKAAFHEAISGSEEIEETLGELRKLGAKININIGFGCFFMETEPETEVPVFEHTEDDAKFLGDLGISW